jgi:diaminopimelate decarboxylase
MELRQAGTGSLKVRVVRKKGSIMNEPHGKEIQKKCLGRMPGLRGRGFEILDRQWVDKVKTPCFIYNIEDLEKKIETIRAAFKGNSYAQYYPVKTNPCLDIVRYCVNSGLGLDACSMGDLEIADILNVQPENISFTTVGLSEQEMRYLYRKKIVPNLSSLEEIKRWARLFPRSRIGVRVSTLTPGMELQGDYSLKMGVFPGDWPKIRNTVLQNNLGIVKLHRHESKNSISHGELLSDFSSTFKRLPGWVWKNVKTINFGGGWGLPYLREGRMDVEELARGIVDITRKLRTSTASEPLKIEIEPGEFLVGESGFLLTTVLDARKLTSHKIGKNLQVVVLDTPFPITSGFRRPELLSVVEFDQDANEVKKETFFTIIYGRSNTSMDTVNKGAFLPEVKVGDLALVLWVGAYVPILLSYFNEQDIPAEFIVKNGALMKSRDSLEFKCYYENAYLKGGDSERV